MKHTRGGQHEGKPVACAGLASLSPRANRAPHVTHSINVYWDLDHQLCYAFTRQNGSQGEICEERESARRLNARETSWIICNTHFVLLKWIGLTFWYFSLRFQLSTAAHTNSPGSVTARLSVGHSCSTSSISLSRCRGDRTRPDDGIGIGQNISI